MDNETKCRKCNREGTELVDGCCIAHDQTRCLMLQLAKVTEELTEFRKAVVFHGDRADRAEAELAKVNGLLAQVAEWRNRVVYESVAVPLNREEGILQLDAILSRLDQPYQCPRCAVLKAAYKKAVEGQSEIVDEVEDGVARLLPCPGCVERDGVIDEEQNGKFIEVFLHSHADTGEPYQADVLFVSRSAVEFSDFNDPAGLIREISEQRGFDWPAMKDTSVRVGLCVEADLDGTPEGYSLGGILGFDKWVNTGDEKPTYTPLRRPQREGGG